MFSKGVFVCSQSGNHPLENVERTGHHPQDDLAKYGYTSEIKYKSLIILLCVWLHNEKPNMQIW
jgi:hypothetical protein